MVKIKTFSTLALRNKEKKILYNISLKIKYFFLRQEWKDLFKAKYNVCNTPRNFQIMNK